MFSLLASKVGPWLAGASVALLPGWVHNRCCSSRPFATKVVGSSFMTFLIVCPTNMLLLCIFAALCALQVSGLFFSLVSAKVAITQNSDIIRRRSRHLPFLNEARRSEDEEKPLLQTKVCVRVLRLLIFLRLNHTTEQKRKTEQKNSCNQTNAFLLHSLTQPITNQTHVLLCCGCWSQLTFFVGGWRLVPLWRWR